MDRPGLTWFGPGPAGAWDPTAAAPRSAARVESGRILHLEAHLARLVAAAEALGAPKPWLRALAPELEAWAAAAADAAILALRLRVHGEALGALLEPLPWTPIPYRLRLMPHPLGEPDRHPLAPYKGLTGAWAQAAVAEARSAGADDALLHWPCGTLVETGLAGIALECGGELWVPPPEGRVAGLAERLDLPGWAGARPIRVRPFTAADLEEGLLWCFNAVRGRWPGLLA